MATIDATWIEHRDKFLKTFNTDACQTIQSVRYWQSLFSLFLKNAFSSETPITYFTNLEQKTKFTNQLVTRAVKDYSSLTDTDSVNIVRGALDCLVVLARDSLSDSCLLFEHEYRYKWIQIDTSDQQSLLIRASIRRRMSEKVSDTDVTENTRPSVTFRSKFDTMLYCEELEFDVDENEDLEDSFSKYFNCTVQVEELKDTVSTLRLTFGGNLSFDPIYGYAQIRDIVLKLKSGKEPTGPFLTILRGYIAEANNVEIQEHSLKLILNILLQLMKSNTPQSKEVMEKILASDTVAKLTDLITSVSKHWKTCNLTYE